MNKPRQAARKECGEAAFTFEVLEDVKDGNALLILSLLKERRSHWQEKLGAQKLAG